MKGSKRLGGWRGTLMILVGVLVGAGLIQPALAHVPHKAHLDNRYVNENQAAGGDLTGTFSNLQLGANSVGTAEIATGAVGSDEIGTGAVGSDEIGTGAVGSAEIGTGAVGSDEIVASAVGGSELAAFTTETSFVLVGGGTAQNAAYTTESVTARCNPGEQLIGGGARWTTTADAAIAADQELFISQSHDVPPLVLPPFINLGPGWSVTGGNDTGTDHHLHAEAYCAP